MSQNKHSHYQAHVCSDSCAMMLEIRNSDACDYRKCGEAVIRL